MNSGFGGAVVTELGVSTTKLASRQLLGAR